MTNACFEVPVLPKFARTCTKTQVGPIQPLATIGYLLRFKPMARILELHFAFLPNKSVGVLNTLVSTQYIPSPELEFTSWR